MNKRTPIELQGKTYQIGFSFLATQEFQEITGKSIFAAETIYDNLVYCYCSLKAINPDFTYTLEQFTDLLDNEPDILIGMQKALDTQKPKQEPTQQPAKKKSSLKLISMLWLLSVLLLVSPVLLPIIFISTWIFRSLKRLYKFIAIRGSARATSLQPSQEN